VRQILLGQAHFASAGTDEDDARILDRGSNLRVDEAHRSNHAVAVCDALDRLQVEGDVNEIAEEEAILEAVPTAQRRPRGRVAPSLCL
jgi:hypothetical protein